MKTLNNYITEKLVIGKNIIHKKPKIQVSTKEGLKKILEKRLAEDKDADLNNIDVSEITDMMWMFKSLDPHNIKINQWDVSNVKDMYGMFDGCTNFNSDLSNWNVSNVQDMENMFYHCKNFNSDLSNWDVSKAKSMNRMFNGCDSLKNKPSWYVG